MRTEVAPGCGHGSSSKKEDDPAGSISGYAWPGLDAPSWKAVGRSASRCESRGSFSRWRKFGWSRCEAAANESEVAGIEFIDDNGRGLPELRGQVPLSAKFGKRLSSIPMYLRR